MKFSPALFAAAATLCLSNCKTMDYLIGPPLPHSTRPVDEEAEARHQQQLLRSSTPGGPTPFASPAPEAAAQPNPFTRVNIYNTIPKVLAVKRPPASDFAEPPNVVDARLNQIEAIIRPALESKGYSIGGSSAENGSVQMDYESSPTMVIGGNGWDYSVTVTFYLGQESIGSSSCRWLNYKPGAFETLLKVLATQAAAKVPAAGKQP